jgi:hypothetical protein
VEVFVVVEVVVVVVVVVVGSSTSMGRKQYGVTFIWLTYFC